MKEGTEFGQDKKSMLNIDSATAAESSVPMELGNEINIKHWRNFKCKVLNLLMIWNLWVEIF